MDSIAAVKLQHGILCSKAECVRILSIDSLRMASQNPLFRKGTALVKTVGFDSQ